MSIIASTYNIAIFVPVFREKIFHENRKGCGFSANEIRSFFLKYTCLAPIFWHNDNLHNNHHDDLIEMGAGQWNDPLEFNELNGLAYLTGQAFYVDY